ncbi:FxLYD domain-containing protein [Aerococcus urinae]
MKPFKKIIALACLCATFFFLSACSSQNKTDDLFFSDLFTTWQKKQEAASQVDKNSDNAGSQALINSFNTEWEEMKKYQDQSFKDKDLENKVKNYLNELKACVDALNQEPATIDSQTAFNDHYRKRIDILKDLSQDSRFIIQAEALEEIDADKNSKALEEAKENLDFRKAAYSQLEEDLNNLQFTVDQAASTDQNIVMTGTLTNHAKADFVNLGITIKFVDADQKELASDTWKTDRLKQGESQTVTIKNTAPQAAHIQIELNDGLSIEK